MEATIKQEPEEIIILPDIERANYSETFEELGNFSVKFDNGDADLHLQPGYPVIDCQLPVAIKDGCFSASKRFCHGCGRGGSADTGISSCCTVCRLSLTDNRAERVGIGDFFRTLLTIGEEAEEEIPHRFTDEGEEVLNVNGTIDSGKPLEVSFRCHLCDRIFAHNLHLIQHLATHSPAEAAIKCGRCNKPPTELCQHRFKHSSSFHRGILRSEQLDDEPKRIKCPICQNLTDGGNLAYLPDVHTGRMKTYVCEVCNSAFPMKENSLKPCLGERTLSSSYACEVCSKMFADGTTRDRHSRRHAKPDHTFKCDLCGKGYPYKSSLVRHMKIHSGKQNKKFKCEVCSEEFWDEISSQDHETVHSGGGGKPFRCDLCDSAFSNKVSFGRHKRLHSGENLLSCFVCEKAFILKSCLEQHMRSHSGDKPYSCGICDVSFVRVSGLTQHQTTQKHKEKLEKTI